MPANKTVLKMLNAFVKQMITDNNMTEDVWMSEDTQNKLKEIMETKKPKADPSHPKRTKSAYMFFCDENRLNIKEKNPLLKPSEVTSKLGESWQLLKESKDKNDLKKFTKFEKLAKEDKLRFDSEMEIYEPSEGHAVKKVEKTKGIPGAKNTYMFFTAETRLKLKESNPDMTSVELKEELKTKWAELKKPENKDELDRFKELADEDKLRWSKDMKDAGLEEKKKKAPSKSKAKKESEDGSKEDEIKAPSKKAKKSHKKKEEVVDEE